MHKKQTHKSRIHPDVNELDEKWKARLKDFLLIFSYCV